MVGVEIDTEKKRRALEMLLESEAFARADQLRSFLRFVVETEIAGQGSEITEYSIGVNALGRPKTFSPTDDSSVRARANALRHKLHEVYQSELVNEPVHIDLPKGSYRPRFVAAELHTPREGLTGLTEVIQQPQPSLQRAAISWKAVAVAFVIGSLLSAAWGMFFRKPGVRINPILKEAWGPLAGPNANVLICIGSELFMVLHTYPYLLPQGVEAYPAPADAAKIWEQRRPLPPGAEMTMHYLQSVMHIGAMVAGATAAKTLGYMDIPYQILPERSVPLAAMSKRNVIMIGNPEFSWAAGRFLESTPLRVEFDNPSRNIVIRERSGSGKEGRTWYPKYDSLHYFKEVYGLITVFPSAGSTDDQQRTAVFSGITAVGAQGAMEFFSSPTHLLELKEQLRKKGYSKFPPAWQAVIKCQTSDTQLVAYEFEGLVVPGEH
ncbi:MAG: hypothetical protein JWO80_854 [Bryobacterales bacterium]|nr:hypothetical protein [Bryobacterales bacterium]